MLDHSGHRVLAFFAISSAPWLSRSVSHLQNVALPSHSARRPPLTSLVSVYDAVALVLGSYEEELEIQSKKY